MYIRTITLGTGTRTYCTVLYCTALCTVSTIQYSTVQSYGKLSVQYVTTYRRDWSPLFVQFMHQGRFRIPDAFDDSFVRHHLIIGDISSATFPPLAFRFYSYLRFRFSFRCITIFLPPSLLLFGKLIRCA